MVCVIYYMVCVLYYMVYYVLYGIWCIWHNVSKCWAQAWLCSVPVVFNYIVVKCVWMAHAFASYMGMWSATVSGLIQHLCMCVLVLGTTAVQCYVTHFARFTRFARFALLLMLMICKPALKLFSNEFYTRYLVLWYSDTLIFWYFDTLIFLYSYTWYSVLGTHFILVIATGPNS